MNRIVKTIMRNWKKYIHLMGKVVHTNDNSEHSFSLLAGTGLQDPKYSGPGGPDRPRGPSGWEGYVHISKRLCFRALKLSQCVSQKAMH